MRSNHSLRKQKRLAFPICCLGCFPNPLLLRSGHGIPNLFFDLQERTRFPSQLHLFEYDLHHLTKKLWFELADKLLQHLLFAGHRFGTNKV